MIASYDHEREMKMPHRTPPDNDHDVGIALWHAVIGLNGGGLITQMKEVRADIQTILDKELDLVTKKECQSTHLAPQNKRRSRWGTVKDVTLMFTSIIAIISGVVGIMLALGLLHIGA